MGAYTSSDGSQCYDDNYGDYYCVDDANIGLWYGGIACISVGGILQASFWITLLVWLVKRRHRRYENLNPGAGTYLSQQTAYRPAPPGEAAIPLTSSTPPPPVGNSPQQLPAKWMKYCGSCGASISTPFCPQCGTRN
jgi:hypothetical protein